MPIVARDSKTIEHTHMIENSINDSSKTTKKIPDMKNNNSDRMEILRHAKQFNSRSFKTSHHHSKLNSMNVSRCPSPNLTAHHNKQTSIVLFQNKETSAAGPENG